MVDSVIRPPVGLPDVAIHGALVHPIERLVR
jgi:hypothetical protein